MSGKQPETITRSALYALASVVGGLTGIWVASGGSLPADQVGWAVALGVALFVFYVLRIRKARHDRGVPR